MINAITHPPSGLMLVHGHEALQYIRIHYWGRGRKPHSKYLDSHRYGTWAILASQQYTLAIRDQGTRYTCVDSVLALSQASLAKQCQNIACAKVAPACLRPACYKTSSAPAAQQLRAHAAPRPLLPCLPHTPPSAQPPALCHPSVHGCACACMQSSENMATHACEQNAAL